MAGDDEDNFDHDDFEDEFQIKKATSDRQHSVLLFSNSSFLSLVEKRLLKLDRN